MGASFSNSAGVGSSSGAGGGGLRRDTESPSGKRRRLGQPIPRDPHRSHERHRRDSREYGRDRDRDRDRSSTMSSPTKSGARGGYHDSSRRDSVSSRRGSASSDRDVYPPSASSHDRRGSTSGRDRRADDDRELKRVRATWSSGQWLTEMEKGDSAIAAAEHEMSLLNDRRKIYLAELELEKKRALRKDGGGADELEGGVPRPGTESVPDVIRRVYTDNRKTAKKFEPEEADAGNAAAAAAAAAATAAAMRVPPDEHPTVVRVVKRFVKFRPLLTRQLWHWKKHDARLQSTLIHKYAKLHKQWQKSLARHNRKEKIIAAEKRRRACFEQSFPEMERIEQRYEVQQQRALLRGDNALQEALRQSLKSVGSKNPQTETFHGHVAKAPPMLLGSKARLSVQINDKNGLVADSMLEHVELEKINVWTPEEESVFLEYYMKHPKKFSRIASHLPNKSCADCVKFYYRTKKQNEYKKKEREKKEEIKKIRQERMKQARKRQQEKSNEYKSFIEGSSTSSTPKKEAAAAADESGAGGSALPSGGEGAPRELPPTPASTAGTGSAPIF